MMVPDETKYRRGELRIEDIEGYQLCVHCDKCPASCQEEMFSDGLFYCTWKHRWLDAMNILQKGCKGYERKMCKSCRKRNSNKCEKKTNDHTMFCDLYECDKWKISKWGMIIGKRCVPPRLSVDAIRAEEEYVKRNRRKNSYDDTRDRGETDYTEKEDGNDRGMGTIQVPDESQEDKVCVDAPAEDSAVLL